MVLARRAYEAERQLKEASQAIAKASELAPQSVPILMASARIYEVKTICWRPSRSIPNLRRSIVAIGRNT